MVFIFLTYISQFAVSSKLSDWLRRVSGSRRRLVVMFGLPRWLQDTVKWISESLCWCWKSDSDKRARVYMKVLQLCEDVWQRPDEERSALKVLLTAQTVFGAAEDGRLLESHSEAVRGEGAHLLPKQHESWGRISSILPLTVPHHLLSSRRPPPFLPLPSAVYQLAQPGDAQPLLTAAVVTLVLRVSRAASPSPPPTIAVQP